MIEAAPAKINLCLHVTGQRTDGYHLLDSLVVFADVGDLIEVRAAPTLSLRVIGPQARDLPLGEDNLVLRAARAFAGTAGAAITLTKNLPVASGIGGGSADAAATLRALARLWDLPLPDADRVLQLGADVPACLAGRTLRMQGIGEQLAAVPDLPEAYLVLVNPGVAVATPAVFKALPSKINPAMPDLPVFATTAELALWLASQRNDLEAPVMALAPAIGAVKQALAAAPGCLLARMSGSGATCFGLFADQAQAQSARAAISAAQPGWWVACGRMLT
ncbi:MAG: 4-(cytidine 5'-diphospho)-2-C-methyl-D-erythritol kinase [Rhodobacteraceae bacterium]|nr:4-(cytidine 5'-diphospho)-2-C-methyl-D-erythritol kinase [Paracoccaceae bacterium]